MLKKLKGEVKDPCQSSLNNYADKTLPIVRDEINEKKRLKMHAILHLKEFIRGWLQTTEKNSIPLDILNAVYYHTLLAMEKGGGLYLKNGKNGKKRIFKKRYCRMPLETWKKCTTYPCPVSKNPENPRCPYDTDDTASHTRLF